jgi:beta-mannosidase
MVMTLDLATAAWTLHVTDVASNAPDAARAELMAGRGVRATVPGCVHTDLMAANLIDDPLVGENEPAQLWTGLRRFGHHRHRPTQWRGN